MLKTLLTRLLSIFLLNNEGGPFCIPRFFRIWFLTSFMVKLRMTSLLWHDGQELFRSGWIDLFGAEFVTLVEEDEENV